MAKSRKTSVNRRGFLKGAAAGAAAGATAMVSGLPSEDAQAPAGELLVREGRPPALQRRLRSRSHEMPGMSGRRRLFEPSTVQDRT